MKENETGPQGSSVSQALSYSRFGSSEVLCVLCPISSRAHSMSPGATWLVSEIWGCDYIFLKTKDKI